MPSAFCVGESLLLDSSGGWRTAASCPSDIELLGVDRLGVLTGSRCLVRGIGQVKSRVYLGTRKACGVFAARSEIISATGDSFAAGNIVAAGSVKRFRFEHYPNRVAPT